MAGYEPISHPPTPRKLYAEMLTLTFPKTSRLLIWLNIFGLALFFLFGWLFLRLTALLRPAYQGSSGGINLWLVINVLLAIVLTFIIHELVHGLFFWIFNRSRPTFGFKGAYAYASAPGWYLNGILTWWLGWRRWY